MEFIAIEDEEGKPLVEIKGDEWRIFDRLENSEVTLFHTTVEDSPFYLYRELEKFDDADDMLRKLSRKSERLEAIFDLFFVERSRLQRRVVCLEKPGFGVLDEFIDRISLSGNQEEGFIVEATTQDDNTHNEFTRNALGEVVNVIVGNVFNGEDFIAAFDEITSDERWDSIGWDWKEIISNLGKSLPALAKEVSELIGDDRRENPRRIKNEFYYFKRIESYFNGNRLDLALESANKGIEVFPFCEILYASRGEVYFSKGLIDEAIKDYETAIHLGMDTPSLFVNAGICYGVKHDYVQAIESYTKAIEIDQKTVNAYLARASAFRALGKIELAQKDKESAEELSAQETANQKPRCELHNLELKEIEVSKPRGFLSYERVVLLFRRRLREVSSELFPSCEVPIPGDTGKPSEETLSIIFRRLACPKCVMLRDEWVAENRERFYEEHNRDVGPEW